MPVSVCENMAGDISSSHSHLLMAHCARSRFADYGPTFLAEIHVPQALEMVILVARFDQITDRAEIVTRGMTHDKPSHEACSAMSCRC